MDVPHYPWHTLGLDLLYYKKQDFFVLADYFLQFLFVRKLPNSTSGIVIKKLSLIFSEYGRPYLHRSCYGSEEFKYFMQEWNIEHMTNTLYCPNGLTEAMVKMLKNMIILEN